MMIAHEAPMSLMKKVRNLTDYDYALPHLLDENKEYSDFFYEQKFLIELLNIDLGLKLKRW